MLDKNNDIFKKNFSSDPFREENWVYEKTDKPIREVNSSKKEFFKLHIDKNKTESKPPKKENKEEKKEEQTEERSFKSIMKDFSRQIIASAIILVIGFLVLNWSAYSKIAESKWNKYMGTEEVSILSELVEANVSVTKDLETSNDPEIQKKQIPQLDLEIAPLDDRLIIPRIDQNIPIVRVSSENLIARDWGALENEIQDALHDGVIHYPGTSLPGDSGNVVITGHSSYFPWDSGNFKDVFALLNDVIEGDNVVIYYNQKKYVYEVTDKKIVLPDDISVLKKTPSDQLTLITCYPIGTNLKRLIVTAKPVVEKADTNKVAR